MTPEERAKQIVLGEICCERATGGICYEHQAIANAIREAVAAEREACAQVAAAEAERCREVRNVAKNINDLGTALNFAVQTTVAQGIADAIRARADVKPAWEWEQPFPMEEML